jgi:multidrug transporter EmrE-like cation transporter
MNELEELIKDFDPLKAATLLTAIESVADYYLKNPKAGPIPGLIGYNVLALVFRALLKKNDLGKTNILWNCGTNLTNLWIGVKYYDEKLTGNQMAGIVLIMTGMGLLYVSK